MQSPETEDRWYVNVGGTPKMMTLDQLVEAFEAGVINSKTLVTEVGGTEWKPLSEVADLGDEEEAPPSVALPPVHPGYAAAPSRAPAPAATAPSYPPAVSRAPQSAWPPVVAAPTQSASFAPTTLSVVPSAPATLPPNSTMPVVQDLSFGLDDDFKPRRSKAPFVAAAALLLVVGGAVSAATLTGGGEIMAPVAVPAAAPPAAPTLNTATTTTTTAAPAPTTPPVPAATTESASEKTAADDSRLNDDVKSKLKEADKTRADKKKAAKATRSTRAPSRSKSGKSEVFRAGGNDSDPLNSKL
jgi:hypothetical protein